MDPILVPLDESPIAEDSIPWAAAIAKAQGRPVHLVTVRPSADAYWEFADVDPRTSVEAHRQTLNDYLEQMRHSEALNGLTVSAEVLDGPIAPQIRWLADRIRASLVVMTTRGRGGFGRPGVGSVAEKLVRTLRVPVVVVPPDVPYVPVESILVPLDGSGESERALAHARALANDLGAALHLLHVIDPDTAWGLSDEEAGRFLDAMRGRAQNYVEGVALAGEHAAVVEGRVPDAILDYAGDQGCRFITMTTHGRRPEPELELGSTADALVRVIDRPVMLITAPPAEERAAEE